jgi:hypothetical protein
MKIIFISFLFLFTFINAKNFGYFYDNSQGKIYLNADINDLKNQSFLENTLLTSKNLKQHYYSSAGSNKFDIYYYSCEIPSLLNNSLGLIKVQYNLPENENILIKEIILDMSTIPVNILPKKYENEFTLTQNKDASIKGKEKRYTIIYDTFGFNVYSKSNLNFKVSKVLLANFRKNKLNYLANLSYNLRKYSSNNTFDIYLRNLPEKFDLHITLDLYDENWKDMDEKILIVGKDFEYPNYKIEGTNPNKTMFIISLIFIGIAFILTIILVLLKLIFGLF